jgi:hypothetical protein
VYLRYRYAGTHRGDRGGAGGIDQAIDAALLFGEATRHRIGAGNVSVVEPEFRSGVDEHESVAGNARIVRPVVEHASVRPRAHDRAEPRGAPAPQERRFDLGLNHPLSLTRPRDPRSGTVSLQRERRGCPRSCGLMRVLAQPQLVEDASRIDHGPRAGTGPPAPNARSLESARHQAFDALADTQSEVEPRGFRKQLR